MITQQREKKIDIFLLNPILKTYFQRRSKDFSGFNGPSPDHADRFSEKPHKPAEAAFLNRTRSSVAAASRRRGDRRPNRRAAGRPIKRLSAEYIHTHITTNHLVSRGRLDVVRMEVKR